MPLLQKFQTLSGLSVRKVGINTKSEDVSALDFAEELASWLTKRHISVAINTVEEDQDILIVLGGDGTLLHIAEQAAKFSIPAIGINLGHLGFLTELTRADAQATLEEILSGNVVVEHRLMLKAKLVTNGIVKLLGYALNDVVINKNANDRILYLAARADDELITTYKSDGLIFSTPTGSTAYNLSSGGPLVYPGLASILVTPICPFMLSSRPILLPSEITLSTSFDTAFYYNDANIIIDGRSIAAMGREDTLIIKRAEHPLQLVVPPHRDYFSILRNKLHWGISERT